jgi:CheY-like chemotaxis protein
MTTTGVALVKEASVLIVEDEGIIARDLRRTLSALGYAVTGMVSTGSEALKVLSTVSADLVLMDIRIDGHLDGIETAERIRERFGIPVIFLTAHSDPSTLGRAMSAEPFGYILKPFTPEDLKVGIEIGLQRFAIQGKLEKKKE